MLKNIKIFTIIFLISSIVWITIDFFFGRNLLNNIKFYNNHGTVHPNFHHTFLPNINKILRWSNKDYTLCTDNNGFRISCDSKNTKEKFFDIALIGDSVTEGVGLNFEDMSIKPRENLNKDQQGLIYVPIKDLENKLIRI